MPIPAIDEEGFLPEGIHGASLRESIARFGAESDTRKQQCELLRQVVAAAKPYFQMKRVMVWGSFVTAKGEPADLDYSVVVSVNYRSDDLAHTDRRFFVPFEARQHYGVDRAFLIIEDYPLDIYV